MIMTVIVPTMTEELELVPAPLPAAGDDPVRPVLELGQRPGIQMRMTGSEAG